MSRNLQFRQMFLSDTKEIGRMLEQESEQYLRYFSAYKSGIGLQKDLEIAKKDLFYTILMNGIICGCFFLRGFDEGYEIPSFGVYISQDYSGRGAASFALANAIVILRGCNVKIVMLKVAPENVHAMNMYIKRGFKGINTCKLTGQIVMHREL